MAFREFFLLGTRRFRPQCFPATSTRPYLTAMPVKGKKRGAGREGATNAPKTRRRGVEERSPSGTKGPQEGATRVPRSGLSGRRKATGGANPSGASDRTTTDTLIPGLYRDARSGKAPRRVQRMKRGSNEEAAKHNRGGVEGGDVSEQARAEGSGVGKVLSCRKEVQECRNSNRRGAPSGYQERAQEEVDVSLPETETEREDEITKGRRPEGSARENHGRCSNVVHETEFTRDQDGIGVTPIRSGNVDVIPDVENERGRNALRTPEGMRDRRRSISAAFDRSLEMGLEADENVNKSPRDGQVVSTDVVKDIHDDDIGVLSRSTLVQKVNSLKGELGSLKEDHTTLKISLKLTQEELKRMREEMNEKNMLIDSLREGVKIRSAERRRADGGDTDLARRKKYVVDVDESFYGFARAVYDRILYYAKLEVSELCFTTDGMERNWTNRCEILGKGTESSVFVVGGNEIVPRCPFEIVSEMRAYTPSLRGGSDELLKYLIGVEIAGHRWESIRQAGKKIQCMQDVARDRCLRQRMKQTLSDVIGVRKRAAREKLFSLLGYDLIARRVRPGEGTELEVELKKQLEEARRKLMGNEGEKSQILCAWRMSAIDDLTYSGFQVARRLREFGGEDMYFKNGAAVEVLAEFMGYEVVPGGEGNTEYVDGTVMHLARLDAWIGCVLTALDTNVGRGGKRQLLFSKLFGEYLPLALENIIGVAWERVRDRHHEELENEGFDEGDPRRIAGNENRKATVALWIPSKREIYLAVRDEYFVEHLTKRLGGVLDCYVAACRPEDVWMKRLPNENGGNGRNGSR